MRRTACAGLIQQVFFAFAGDDVEFFATADPGDLIGIKSGGVDHILRLNGSAVGTGQRPDAIFIFSGADFEIAGELHAVFDGRFHQTEHISVRFDRAAIGSEKAAADGIVQFRFQFQHPGAVAEFQIGHAVIQTPLIQFFHRFQLFCAVRRHQDPALVIGKAQFFMQHIEKFVAPQFQLGFQGVGWVMKAAVYDPGIGFGHAERGIRFLFQQDRFALRVGKLPRSCRPAGACTDNGSIVDHESSPCLFSLLFTNIKQFLKKSSLLAVFFQFFR